MGTYYSTTCWSGIGEAHAPEESLRVLDVDRRIVREVHVGAEPKPKPKPKPQPKPEPKPKPKPQPKPEPEPNANPNPNPNPIRHPDPNPNLTLTAREVHVGAEARPAGRGGAVAASVGPFEVARGWG